MTKCDLCPTEEYEVVFDGPIRDGVVGNVTEIAHKVVKCKGCGLVRLLENPLNMAYYQSDEYRKAYNGSAEVSDYIDMHDEEQVPRLNRVSIDAFRDKVVLDHGCGGGAFLDLVKGVAAKTIAVEPFQGFHESLAARGHEVFSDASAALEKFRGGVDTVTSFGVLEHVEEPVQYLKNSYDLLCAGGQMYLETDNLDELLMKIGMDEFDSFFYRTAHLWYYNAETLKSSVEKAGFDQVNISFRHNFDISNMVMWLRDGKPTGMGRLDLFDSRINAAWVDFIEESGMADLVCVDMVKS